MSSNPRITRLAAFSLVFIILVTSVAVVTVITYRHRVLPRGEDLLDFGQSWTGAHLMLAGENPYDYEGFYYPATILIILLPFFLLPVYVATALWAALQVAFAVASILLWLRTLDIHLKPLLTAALMLAGLIAWRYPMISYASSNFVDFTLFCIVASAWLAGLRHDWWAGAILSLATIRSESAVIALLFTLYFAWQHRWRFVAGAGTTLLGLLAVSFVVIGFWMPDFVARVHTYAGVAFAIWPPSLVHSAYHLPLFGLMILASVSILKTAGVNMPVVLSLIVVNVLMFSIATNPYVLALLLIPLLAMLRYFRSKLSYLLWLALITLPWTRPRLRWFWDISGLIDLVLMPPLTISVFALDHWLGRLEDWVRRLSRVTISDTLSDQ